MRYLVETILRFSLCDCCQSQNGFSSSDKFQKVCVITFFLLLLLFFYCIYKFMACSSSRRCALSVYTTITINSPTESHWHNYCDVPIFIPSTKHHHSEGERGTVIFFFGSTIQYISEILSSNVCVCASICIYIYIFFLKNCYCRVKDTHGATCGRRSWLVRDRDDDEEEKKQFIVFAKSKPI